MAKDRPQRPAQYPKEEYLGKKGGYDLLALGAEAP